MDIAFEVRPYYVMARITGSWDVASARDAIDRVIGLCDANDVTRIMVDGSGVSTVIPISDRYDMATQFAAASRGRMRMSLLMTTENMFSKTFENTAANRGVHVRTTDSLQEALAFLQLPC